MTFKKENLKTRGEIADKVVSGDKMSEWDFQNLCKFKCNHCGAYISPAVVEYYDYRVDRALCHDCQAKGVDLQESIDECEKVIKDLEETEEEINEPHDEYFYERKTAEENRKNFNPDEELSEKDKVRLGIRGSICVRCGEKATTVNQAGEPSCSGDSWIGN